MTCTHCVDAGRVFDRRTARWEAVRYRWFGPSRPTRFLLDMVQTHAGEELTLLDVGGGVGVIAQKLAPRLSAATSVDASGAYLAVAREQATRYGYADRVAFIEGDFVDLAYSIPLHDVVTLDRVVCCYPDMDALVRVSSQRAARVLVLVFPKEGLLNRMAFPLSNLLLRLKKSAFRIFLHPTSEVDARVHEQGLRLAEVRRTLLWQTRVYVRAEDESPGSAAPRFLANGR